MWCEQGYKDSRHLFRNDFVHLNEKGYKVLDSCIAKVIIKDLKNEN